jgi:hypothetical protein
VIKEAKDENLNSKIKEAKDGEPQLLNKRGAKSVKCGVVF